MAVTACSVVATGDLLAGDVWSNTWHVEAASLGGPLAQSDAQDVADQFETFYTSALGLLCSAGTTLAQITVTDLTTSPGNKWYFFTPLDPTGGTVMPQINACAVSLRSTVVAGPTNRGRIYLPLTDQAALAANGTISGATRTTLLGYVGALASNLIANTLSEGIVVYSRKLEGITSVNLCQIDSIPDTQRGRRNRILPGVTSGPISFGP